MRLDRNRHVMVVREQLPRDGRELVGRSFNETTELLGRFVKQRHQRREIGNSARLKTQIGFCGRGPARRVP